jgi:hypothetical protein
LAVFDLQWVLRPLSDELGDSSIPVALAWNGTTMNDLKQSLTDLRTPTSLQHVCTVDRLALPGALRRTLGRSVFALVFWYLLASVAWAQPDQKKEEAGKPAPYLLSYTLVILGVGLGMMVVCRSSRRKDRAKAEAVTPGLTAEQLKGSGRKAPTGMTPRGKEMCKEAQESLTGACIAFVIPALGLVLGPFSLWKAIQARKLIKQNPRLTGDKIAIAGLVASIAAIVAQLVWIIVIIAALT